MVSNGLTPIVTVCLFRRVWRIKSELEIALAGVFLLQNPERQGLGITARTWFEYVLSEPLPATAVLT